MTQASPKPLKCLVLMTCEGDAQKTATRIKYFMKERNREISRMLQRRMHNCETKPSGFAILRLEPRRISSRWSFVPELLMKIILTSVLITNQPWLLLALPTHHINREQKRECLCVFASDPWSCYAIRTSSAGLAYWPWYWLRLLGWERHCQLSRWQDSTYSSHLMTLFRFYFASHWKTFIAIDSGATPEKEQIV